MTAHLIRVSLLTFILATVAFSCTDKTTTDESLSVEEYKKLGMPDPEKSWTMEEYKQAYNVLAKRKWTNPLQLPAKDSEKSGLLFEHMVSLEYLSFMNDSTISLNEKARLISEFTRVYEYWMDIYKVPTLPENHYHREILDVQIFNLHLMEAMVDLAQKINVSDDPADRALRYGYESIKNNYLTSLYADLRTQSKAAGFLKQDLDRMSDTIYSSVMRNQKWMDSSAINALTRTLQTVIDSTSSDYARSKYQRLAESLAENEKQSPNI